MRDKKEVKLIVPADEPALFFSSIKEAESYIEPEDVESGIFKCAFGPNGEIYNISTDGRRVNIERSEHPDNPNELEELLLQYFSGLDLEIGRGLPALLAECRKYISS